MQNDVKIDKEWESYECTNTITAGDSEYCEVWSSQEEGPDEYEIGEYTCEESQTIGPYTYCSEWRSVQKETKKCKGAYDCSPDCRYPTYCFKQCCDDDGGCRRDCWRSGRWRRRLVRLLMLLLCFEYVVRFALFDAFCQKKKTKKYQLQKSSVVVATATNGDDLSLLLLSLLQPLLSLADSAAPRTASGRLQRKVSLCVVTITFIVIART